jgi:GNAT superfamily N-acetyltransferase
MSVEIKAIDQMHYEKETPLLWQIYNQEMGVVFSKNVYYFSIILENTEIGFLRIDVRGGVAYLDDIIIKSEYRGQKIGYEGVEFFMNFSKEKRCHKMRIKTCPELSPAAYHIYVKLGFVEEARLKKDYFGHDWVILAKFLDNK